MNLDNPDANVINVIEQKIKLFESKDFNKSRIKSHACKIMGEKPTEFFRNFEKHRMTNNLIVHLVDVNSKQCEDSSSLCQCVNAFYKDLYTSRGINYYSCNIVLNTVDKCVLDDELEKDLNTDFSEDELFQAVMQMSKEKSPGLDGLTAEFYQTFWLIIKNEFKEVVDECKKTGRLPRSMNMALIRLIFKNKGERVDLKNWRPISLLNVDYKIISKVLTNRLKKIMPLIINEDQSSGVIGKKHPRQFNDYQRYNILC